MLHIINEIKKLIGDTPVVKLRHSHHKLYAKLECYNFSGSIKDRAVNNILSEAIRTRKITRCSTVIESSSGNFAISAAMHCKWLGIDFYSVVDPFINPVSLKKLKMLATKVIQVTEPDETGGYLLNRINTVKQVVGQTPGCYWTNQYANTDNYKGYRTLANEIAAQFVQLDYVFVAVSSTGTIVGLSKYLKEIYPAIKIIAIDIKGSMIFSDEKCRRFVPGIGASKKSDFLDECEIDDVVILDGFEILKGCDLLLKEQSLFMGASSGACYFGALKYLNNLNNSIDHSSVLSLIICPDEGTSYMDTIYNEEWRQMQVNTTRNYINV